MTLLEFAAFPLPASTIGTRGFLSEGLLATGSVCFEWFGVCVGGVGGFFMGRVSLTGLFLRALRVRALLSSKNQERLKVGEKAKNFVFGLMIPS